MKKEQYFHGWLRLWASVCASSLDVKKKKERKRIDSESSKQLQMSTQLLLLALVSLQKLLILDWNCHAYRDKLNATALHVA